MGKLPSLPNCHSSSVEQSPGQTLLSLCIQERVALALASMAIGCQFACTQPPAQSHYTENTTSDIKNMFDILIHDPFTPVLSVANQKYIHVQEVSYPPML